MQQTYSDISALITRLRQESRKDSISPERVGYLMQMILDHYRDISVEELDKRYLSRISEDAASGHISFADGITVGEGRIEWDDAKKAVKFISPIYSQGYITAKGAGAGGGAAAGASLLSQLGDVSVSAPAEGHALAYDAASGKWVNRPAAAGLDRSELALYLTQNGYAKRTDIPSLSGYATQQWVQSQGYMAKQDADLAYQPKGAYLTSVSWADITGKPESFTPSEHSHTQYALATDLAGKLSVATFNAFVEKFDSMFVIDDAGNIKAKRSLWSPGYITAKGAGAGGAAAAGASLLSQLGDVSVSAPAEGHALAYDAASGKWVNRPAAAGLDRSELALYLTQEGYAKATDISAALAPYAKLSDIPSLSGYATQQWVEGKGYLTAITKAQVEAVLSGNITSHAHSQYLTSLPARLSQYITSALSDGNGFGRMTSATPFKALHTSKDDCMLVTTGYSDAWRGELALDYHTNNIAYRNKNNGTWNDWAMVLTNKNFATYFTIPTSMAWSAITGKPATLSGYGITDAYAKSDIDTKVTAINNAIGAKVSKAGDTMSGALTVNAKVTAQSLAIGSNTLEWDAAAGAWKITGSLYATGYITAKGAGAGGSASSGSSLLSALGDVSLSSPAAGHALVYNGTKWVNQAMAALDTASLAAYLTQNGYATQSWANTRLASYLPLSGGTLTGRLTIGTSGKILILGSRNESWAHYETSATSGHWFNKDVYVHGEIYAGASYSQKVWHSGNLTPSNYLLASAYTAADVLAKLKTVDGAGSGLDADTLDGKHNGEVRAKDWALQGIAQGADLNTFFTRGVYASTATAVCASLVNSPSTTNNGEAWLEVKDTGSTSYLSQFLYKRNGTNFEYWTRTFGNGTFGNWHRFAFTSDIPTKVSQLTNDASYLTTSGTAANSDKLDGLHATSFGRAFSASYSFGGSLTEITTAQFITLLTNLGAFNQPYWVAKGSWSYATNNIITDSGLGNIQLAGAVVEVFGCTGAYTIRITTSPESSPSGVTNAVFIYRNHGSNYAPNWKRLANTSDIPTSMAWTAITGKPNVMTTDTAQEISGVKTFNNGFKLRTADSWTSSDRTIPFGVNGDSSTIQWYNDNANTGLTFNPSTGALKAAKFIKRGGTSSQFLKADGSVDSTAYLPKTGGTIKNAATTTLLAIDTDSTSEVGMVFRMGSVNKSWVGYVPAVGACLYNYAKKWYFGLKDDGSLYYNGGTIWHSGNDGSGSGLDADTLDGRHMGGFAYYAGNLSGTIGSGSPAADTKAYWSASATANMVTAAYNNSGVEYSFLFSKAPSGTYGSVLKWGYTDAYMRILRIWGSAWQSDDWEKISAGYADRAGIASKLATARTIWGQSFDGTASVSGNMTGVGSITASGALTIPRVDIAAYLFFKHTSAADGKGIYCSADADGSLNIAAHTNTSWTANIIKILQNGNVGVGTSTPAYKLDVGGNIIADGWIRTRGARGWYSETYGGGMYMNDSTWVRVYNSKKLYVGNIIHSTTGITCDGYITAKTGSSSDERLKDIIGAPSLSIQDIAASPLVRFRWKGRPTGPVAVGTLAQYWLTRLPEVVYTDPDGYYAVQYGVLADAKATVVARVALRHEREIDRLKRRVEELEQQVRLLKAS